MLTPDHRGCEIAFLALSLATAAHLEQRLNEQARKRVKDALIPAFEACWPLTKTCGLLASLGMDTLPTTRKDLS